MHTSQRRTAECYMDLTKGGWSENERMTPGIGLDMGSVYP